MFKYLHLSRKLGNSQYQEYQSVLTTTGALPVVSNTQMRKKLENFVFK